MTARTRTRLAALLATSVVVLAGCGTEDDPRGRRPQPAPTDVEPRRTDEPSPTTPVGRATARHARARSRCRSTSSARRRRDRGCSASSATSRRTTRSTRRWRSSPPATRSTRTTRRCCPAARRRWCRATPSQAIGVNLPSFDWTERPDGMSARGGQARRPADRLHGPGRAADPGAGRVLLRRARARASASTEPASRRPRRTTCSPSSTSPSPARARRSAARFTASGVANSFEATVPWQIRDRAATKVLEGFATAEGWGDHLYPWQSAGRRQRPGARAPTRSWP